MPAPLAAQPAGPVPLAAQPAGRLTVHLCSATIEDSALPQAGRKPEGRGAECLSGWCIQDPGAKLRMPAHDYYHNIW